MKRSYQITVNGESYTVENAIRMGSQLNFSLDGANYSVSVNFNSSGASQKLTGQTSARPISQSIATQSVNSDQIVAPMPGIVVSIAVKPGERVTLGQTICVIEAMKMENNITAQRDGVVKALEISVGQEVGNRQVLARLESI